MKKKSQKNSCGPGKAAFLIPQFIFKASCKKHDDYYKEGGGIVEKVYADTMFYAFMLEDIKKGGYSFFRKYSYFKIATFYYLFVLTFGWIPWIYQFIKRKLK